MSERLAEAIEELDVPVDGPVLAAALWLLDRLDAKVTAAVGAFDAAAGWEAAGATSMTAWLRHHGGLTGGQAGALVRTAGALRRLPVTAEAWADGRLCGGRVKAVVANVRPATVDLLAADEAVVVDAVSGLSVADTAAAMQHWARRAEALVDDGADRHVERSMHVSSTLAGRVEMSGSLDAEGGAVVTPARRYTRRRRRAGPDAGRAAGRRQWSTCAGGSSTTSTPPGEAAGGPTRTSSSTSTTWRRVRAGAWSTARPSTPRPSTGCCATRRCTGC